jgi:adenylate cyclase
MACRAALACIEETRKLFASSAWDGMPALVTRFGLHRAEVMVGHFGAPDRMSFTAIGDGVNLASRLEGLNKQYGTTILVSETIRQEAKEQFLFRRVDRVAVKGRSAGIDVYELCGHADQPSAGDRLTTVRTYEHALTAYLARDFHGAIALLDAQREDAPSVVLAERCRVLIKEPPPADWSGVFVASTK